VADHKNSTQLYNRIILIYGAYNTSAPHDLYNILQPTQHATLPV